MGPTSMKHIGKYDKKWSSEVDEIPGTVRIIYIITLDQNVVKDGRCIDVVTPICINGGDVISDHKFLIRISSLLRCC